MQDNATQFEQYRISQFGEPYLYSVNRNVFEKSLAKNVFSSFYENRLWEEDYFYIILGCDGGLLADYIIEHGLARGSRYLFVDSTHVIENLSQQLSFTQWNDKIALCSLDNWERIAANFDLQAYMYTDKVRYLKSLAANDGYDDFYNSANTELSLKLETKQHYTMVSLYRAPFVVKQIINITENINPQIELKNKFAGLDCIILGGGPSLDEVIEDLKNINNDVVIFAVSRIAKRLLSENIKPHFIVSVDPHEVSFDVSKEMLEMADESIFLHSTYVVPVLLGQWRGISFHDGLRVPWPSKLLKENVHMAGPTVTNSCISTAVEFGFKRIFLSGVDLCYSSSGHTHAKGSNEANVGPVLGKREQWVKTYGGNLAETMMTFIHAVKTIDEQARNALEKGCEIFNLSPNAAKIEHIKLANLTDITTDKTTEISNIFNEIKDKYAHIKPKQYESVLTDINRFMKEISKIEDIVEKAIKDNKALYKEYENDETNSKIKYRLDKAEKKLSTTFEKSATFLKKYGIHRFIKIARTDSDEDWSDEEMEKIGHTYYQCFLDNINELRPLLIAAKKKIKLRIQETQQQTDYQEILTQWSTEAQFGRAYNWKLKNPNWYNELTTKDKEEFDRQIKLYFDILKNTQTYHLRRTEAESSLDGVNRKVVYLFNTKNSEGLFHLKTNLSKLAVQDQKVQSLITLTSAYYAVLQEDPNEALRLFNMLDESMLTEDEYIQISVAEIATLQYQAAESSLSKLSQLMHKYKPMYATVLKLNNKIPEAANEYLDYLNDYPQDIKAWLALSQLYIDIEAFDNAQTALHEILKLEPENAEAQHHLANISKVK